MTYHLDTSFVATGGTAGVITKICAITSGDKAGLKSQFSVLEISVD